MNDTDSGRLLSEIESQAEAEKERILSDARARADEVREKARAEVLRLEEEAEREFEKRSALEKEKILGRIRMEEKKRLLSAQHAALKKVFDRARARLLELLGSDRYPTAVKELMRQALSALGEDGDLVVTRDDRELCSSLGKRMGLSSAVRGEGSGHGKVIAVSRDGLRVVENSVMKRLEKAGEERMHEVAKILFENTGGRE